MTKREVVFIDNGVDDLEVLLAGIRPDVQPVLLNASESAPRQMARALAVHPEWNTVHVIAHGSPGMVAFSAGELSVNTLADADLDLSGRNLALWSCKTAAGDAGAKFISELAQATGATVSASTQIVGHAQKSGSWNLDGADTPSAPLTTFGRSSYSATFAYTYNSVTVSTVATDNYVNATEGGSSGFTVVGTGGYTGSSDPTNGSTVNVTLTFTDNNGHTSTSIVSATISSLNTSSNTFTWTTAAIPNLGSTTLVEGADHLKAVIGTGTSSSFSFTLDKTAPTAVATVTAISTDTGTLGDFITNTAAQTVTGTYTGTLGSGETIQVSADGGTTWVSATNNSTTHTFTASGVTLAAGAGTLTVRAIDTAGNTLSGTSHGYTLDTTSTTPTLTSITPDTGTSATDGTTNSATISVIGTAEASAVVTVFDGATSVGTATANGSGAWTATGITLNNGTNNLTATAKDVAGNTSSASSIFTATLDTAAPTAVATVTALSTDTGTPSDFITNTAAQTVTGTYTGTLGSGETIQVSADGGTTWVSATNNSTTHTFTASGVTLAAGAGTLTVRAIDTAGNTLSGTSHGYTLDTTTPAGTAPDLITASDSGASGTDNLTNVTSPTFTVALTAGTVAVGDTVQLLVGGAALAHDVTHTITSADISTGSVTLTVTASDLGADGVKSVTAKLTDAAGNTSTTSALSVTLDTTSTTPTLTSITPDTGSSSSDGATNSATISVIGTAEANAVVTVLDGGVSVGVATANGSGAWTATGVTLSNGANSLTATAKDVAGNTSSPSATFTATLDTTAPSATATVVSLSADTGTAGDFITKTAAQTVNGTLSSSLGAGESVQVSADGGSTWVTASVTGTNWSASGITLSGSGSLTVKTVDTAGNTTTGVGHSYTLDTTAPTGALPDLLTASDSGASNTDNLTNVTAPTITIGLASGTVAVGDTVQLLLAGAALAHDVTHTLTAADISAGSVSLSITGGDLGADGAKAISAKLTDAAGNTSTTSVVTVTLDTVTTTPTGLALAASSDSGQAGDGVTNDTTPTFTGTAEAGAVVKLYDGATSVGAATANGSGAFTVTASTLTAAAHTFTVVATDTAGNVSSPSAPLAVTIDNVAPTAIATVTALSPDTGTSSTDFLTNAATQTVSGTYSGTLATGESIQVSANGSTWITATASNGTWTASGVTLSTGNGKSLTVQTIDTAANVKAGTGHAYTLDQTAPSATLSGNTLTLASTSDTGTSNSDKITSVTKPTVTVSSLYGKAMSAGDVIDIIDTSNGNTVVGSYVVQSGDLTFFFGSPIFGNGWSGTTKDITLSSALDNGVHKLAVQMSDAAGNTTTASTVTLDLTIDTIAPNLASSTDLPNSDTVVASGPTETLTVHFSEKVLVTGAPTLTLSNGDSATYVSGSNSQDLTFTFTPAHAGSNVTITGINTTAGTIKDTAGNAATLPSDTPICFMAGTHVRTPTGEVNVEDLAIGDLVLTSEGAVAPVRWIGRQTVSRLFADALKVDPIRVRAGALGDNLPVRDLLVSPDHALLVDGILIHAGALVNGASITRETGAPATFVYYHVELDDHSLVLAEGVPAETFIDHVERLAFDNWQEHEAMYPEGRQIVEMAYPRAKAYRQVPQKFRNRLMTRAAELFGEELVGAA